MSTSEEEPRQVQVDSWSDFFMVLRSVLAELPPATTLILQPDGDQREAHIRARPEPAFEVRVGGDRIAKPSTRSLSDVIAHVEGNVEDHWGLRTPHELSYTYEGPAGPRLWEAFADTSIIGDLPEAERPTDRAHTSGEGGDAAIGGRLDPDVAEKLRRLGSSAID